MYDTQVCTNNESHQSTITKMQVMIISNQWYRTVLHKELIISKTLVMLGRTKDITLHTSHKHNRRNER